MKNKLIRISFLMLLALNGIAQSPKSGIYKTFADYDNNKLAYDVDCKTEKQTIKLNEFLNEPYITIKHKGAKIKLQKDSIYAVLNCEGLLMRFQSKEHFTLVEKGQVWIFYKEITVSSGKAVTNEKQYYFSTKGDGKIIELTVNNIKYAFPENRVLHDMLDVQLKNDQDIYSYDALHKMFKINQLITVSKK